MSTIEIIAQGCKAGLLAGILWGVLLVLLVSPLIRKAEFFEEKTLHQVQAGEDHHAYAAADFEPNTWQRPLLTVLGTLLLGISFGILASLGLALGTRLGMKSTVFFQSPWISGTLMGFCGFLIFQGIPSLGLPPPLPGTAGASGDLSARQSWWVLSVFCSVGGLLSLKAVPFFLREKIAKKWIRGMISVLLAILFIAFPFLAGVPKHAVNSVVPAALNKRFLLSSLLVNGAFWLVLGISVFSFLKQYRIKNHAN